MWSIVNDVALVFLLLTLNIFHTFFKCFLLLLLILNKQMFVRIFPLIVFTVKFNCKSMVSTKRSYLLKQTCNFHIEVCLNMYDLLLDNTCQMVNHVFFHRKIFSIVLSFSKYKFICISTKKYLKQCVQHSTFIKMAGLASVSLDECL